MLDNKLNITASFTAEDGVVMTLSDVTEHGLIMSFEDCEGNVTEYWFGKRDAKKMANLMENMFTLIKENE